MGFEKFVNFSVWDSWFIFSEMIEEDRLWWIDDMLSEEIEELIV